MDTIELTLERVLWATSSNATPLGSIIDRLSGGKPAARGVLQQQQNEIISKLDALHEKDLITITHHRDETLYTKRSGAMRQLKAEMATK